MCTVRQVIYPSLILFGICSLFLLFQDIEYDLWSAVHHSPVVCQIGHAIL